MMQPFVGSLTFGYVAANEEMPLLRFGPHTRPSQIYARTGLVQVSCFKVARVPTAARQSHLLASCVEIVGVDEVSRVVANHFLGIIAQDCIRAWAYPTD